MPDAVSVEAYVDRALFVCEGGRGDTLDDDGSLDSAVRAELTTGAVPVGGNENSPGLARNDARR